jgi:hypothetical protein
MIKYAEISNEILDELCMDIFQVKKLNQIDPESNVNYMEFVD